MNFFRSLKSKTWIDWIKIIVAIDLASAGVGLIFNIPLHVIAPILGFITRILMGVMYIFVALLIIKRVFPPSNESEKNEKTNIDTDVKEGVKKGKGLFNLIVEKADLLWDRIVVLIDSLFDRIEGFFKRKKDEVQGEMKKLLDD